MIAPGARPPFVDSHIAPEIAPESVFRTPWARRWAMVVVVLMAAWVALAWVIHARRLEERLARGIEQARALAQARAGLVEDGLRQGLAPFEGVAQVLARLPEVEQAVQAVPSARLAALDALLAAAARDLGADLVYLLDAEGRCIAASNAGAADSVVGERRIDTAFFEQTRANGHARLFAVGRTTGVAGMYFASAVLRQGRFAGVLVVKRNTLGLASLLGHEGVFVVDGQGVVVLAQNPQLQLQAIEGAAVFALDPAQRLARYQRANLEPLRIARWSEDAASPLRRIGADAQARVIVQRPLRREGLEVYVAQPVPELEALRRQHLVDFLLLALAGDGAIALIAAGLGGWRSRRSVLDAVDRIALANRHLSVEIGERQRAEMLLRESREFLLANEARLRALLRSLPEQVWMKDRAGAYLAVNAEFERFHGRRETELLGKSDHEMEDPRRAADYAEQDRATLDAAEPLVFHEAERSAAGGKLRQLEITKTAVRDDQGRVIGVVGVARDTTEFNAAQQALRNSEARLRATFETAGDAILIVRKGVLVDCNPSAAGLLGAADREQLQGQAIKLFAPEFQPDGAASRRQLQLHVDEVRHGGTKTFEWRCRRLDGAEFDAEITISVFRHDGQSLLQALLRDVSERRRMMEALEAARDAAERANRSKSVFLANMSHEIRTPLNAVLGFTQLLLADHALPQEVQARLRVIHSAGNRLLGLINDVLDLAKIESGGLQVARAPFDLLQELRDIDHLFAIQARARGLAWQFEPALQAPAIVEGDRNKLGQILSNLLGNALKFTERGRLELRAWRAGEVEGEAEDRVWFEVGDTGPGMAPAELAALFVPFRQGAAGQEKGGTGLGLALSRDMARAMGGDLSVDSAPGAGTRARFWLPLPASQATPVGAVVGAGAQVLAPQSTCTVLVIEDDAHSRDVLAGLLEAAGCAVAQAHDGREGLALCQAQRFDIVFSDIRMPRMDGVELIGRLRADPRTRALPVIAVSASSLEHERRFYIEAGFQEFIGKPYPFQQVYRVLVDFAGVRLVDAQPVAPADEGDLPLSLPALTAPVRAALLELAQAAALGGLDAVRRQLAALAPQALGTLRWRELEEAAQAYDFQRIEQRVRDWLGQD